MSQENVERVRASVDALNRGDLDAAFIGTAPDFEFDMSRAVGPVHGVFRGIDAARKATEEAFEPWESSRYAIEKFIEVGDHVVAPFTNYLRGRDGIEVQARGVWMWTIRGGVGVRLAYFHERDDALEAAALE